MQSLEISHVITIVVFVLTSAVAAIVWFVRLEGRVNYIEKLGSADKGQLEAQIVELRTKHEALDNKIVDKLSAIEKSLARIQGKLSINE